MPLADKEARSAYNRAYHARRRKQGLQAAYMREFYAKRKRRLQDLKAERACARCGFNDPRALQFHHRDPSQKEFPIGRDAWKVSWDRLMAEVEKCDILCANCHQIEHYGESA